MKGAGKERGIIKLGKGRGCNDDRLNVLQLIIKIKFNN
jgi:hypothetical protein